MFVGEVRSEATAPVHQALAAALVRYLVTPILWPIGWARVADLLAATAAAESAEEPTAVGDGGASVGLFQFHASNLRTYAPKGWTGGADWRTDPVLAGDAAVRYLADAVRRRPELLARLAIPGAGYLTIRRLWTHGQDATIPAVLELGANTAHLEAQRAARVEPAQLYRGVVDVAVSVAVIALCVGTWSDAGTVGRVVRALAIAWAGSCLAWNVGVVLGAALWRVGAVAPAVRSV